MAVAYVSGSEQDANSATSRTAAEPAGAAQNDLILCVASITSTNGTWSTVPSDMTAIDASIVATVGNPLHHIGCWYKIRGSTAGDALTFGYSGTAGQIRASAFAFSGVDTAQPFDVTFSEASHFAESSNDVNAAAAAITTNTNGAMVFLHATYTQNDITAAGAPSGYTLQLSEIGVAGRQLATATKTVVTADTETPGVWTHTGGAAADGRILTFAIKPSVTASSASVVLKRRRGF